MGCAELVQPSGVRPLPLRPGWRTALTMLTILLFFFLAYVATAAVILAVVKHVEHLPLGAQGAVLCVIVTLSTAFILSGVLLLQG